MCVLMTESKGRWTGKISEERQEETQKIDHVAV